ncbi:hypothetical protein Acr_09g0008580 [Actinidia rufa]|uniref:Uncharacterized protein n=1 Tax=Actinidia rufa TaxID=165716 RepID=A0A7J0F6S2_9ERIC|nr:hypothetical protein Acr_09g0008580 [Actinidia rufa]
MQWSSKFALPPPSNPAGAETLIPYPALARSERDHRHCNPSTVAVRVRSSLPLTGRRSPSRSPCNGARKLPLPPPSNPAGAETLIPYPALARSERDHRHCNPSTVAVRVRSSLPLTGRRSPSRSPCNGARKLPLPPPSNPAGAETLIPNPALARSERDHRHFNPSTVAVRVRIAAAHWSSIAVALTMHRCSKMIQILSFLSFFLSFSPAFHGYVRLN